MQYGRYFDEFELGAVYKHEPGRTITESDDTLFCMLTMNHHPVHIDHNFAASTQFGKPLVVGTLVLSISVGQSVQDISGKAVANLEYEKVNHDGPVFHGDTIYSETRVLELRESKSNPDRGIVYVETIARNQRGEQVLSYRRRVLVPKKPR